MTLEQSLFRLWMDSYGGTEQVEPPDPRYWENRTEEEAQQQSDNWKEDFGGEDDSQ